MKKFLLISSLLFSLVGFSQTIKGDFEGYLSNVNSNLGIRDTLTNTDTTKYRVTLTGSKSNITFSVVQTKLTGTVAGKVSIIAGVDSTTSRRYFPTPVISDQTITDGSKLWEVSFTSNKYKYYELQIISSGTNTQWNQVWLNVRKAP